MFGLRGRTSEKLEWVPACGMAPHSFTYGISTYEIRFQRMDGQWFATLYICGSERGQPLLSLPDKLAATVADDSIRSGFIGLGEWMVRSGRWPDDESKSRDMAAAVKSGSALVPPG